MTQLNKGTPVPVPHLAESLVSATVGKWLKKPGDYVQQYDVICELITEKVNVEMPSPVEGTILELLVEEGRTAAVGEAICLIAEPGTVAVAAGTAVKGAAGQTELGGGTQAAGGDSLRSRFSPAVLTLAAEHGVELSEVEGTGLGGRITRKDVLAYVAGGKRPAAGRQEVSKPAPAPAPVMAAVPAASQDVRSSGIHLSLDPPTPLLPQVVTESGNHREYYIDVTPIRNAIARNMRQSVSEIPHAWTMIEVDVTNLVVLRSKIKDDFARQEGINLTYLPFLIKAVVNAIKDYPILNSVWAVDKIIVKRDINVSLAVGTEDSVLTPVIKKADQKNIAGLAQEMDQLGKKARAGKLTPDDMVGGTFTVNNTGSFGSILSYPIVNYPQAAILTFESIVKKPVVINDMIAVRSMVNLCLSLDHRILDGVICGRFLQRVKENLEGYNLDTKLY
jgi:2-oxoisovalerate dehydrogenase E2 component (dihydrolipoyl transacylase)